MAQSHSCRPLSTPPLPVPSINQWYNGFSKAWRSQSTVGVIVFLRAHNRYASANATFVIHKTRFNPGTPTDAERARGFADAMKIDDERTLDILKANCGRSSSASSMVGEFEALYAVHTLFARCPLLRQVTGP